jgi:pimeloyl-ACP methyl ester carboxylesterase
MREIVWRSDDISVTLGLNEVGAGDSVLLLPALSSISTRAEMMPLALLLAERYRISCVDWPGFGDGARPRLDWTPNHLAAFLSWLLTEIVPHPRAVAAAGHAATYLLQHAARDPSFKADLILVAPTWRGPFPTMMKGQRPWFRRVRQAVDNPFIGPMLYRLNLSGPVVRRMAAEHVYSDPAWLTPARMDAKRRVTSAPGARHASVRFVTGALDPVDTRDAFLALARQVSRPIHLIYGADTPPKSLAEMEALGRLPMVETSRLPRGRLSVHEEFPERMAAEVRRILAAPDVPPVDEQPAASNPPKTIWDVHDD